MYKPIEPKLLQLCSKSMERMIFSSIALSLKIPELYKKELWTITSSIGETKLLMFKLEEVRQIQNKDD